MRRQTGCSFIAVLVAANVVVLSASGLDSLLSSALNASALNSSDVSLNSTASAVDSALNAATDAVDTNPASNIDADAGIGALNAGLNTATDAMNSAGTTKTATTTQQHQTAGGVGGGTFHSIDFLLLQDLSISYLDDLVPLGCAASNLVISLGQRACRPQARLGLASFVDKNIDPHGIGDDHEYRTMVPLTDNHNEWIDALQNQAQRLKVYNGNDKPESQMTALLQACLRTDELGWRPANDESVARVVVLTTDADFHRPGDCTGCSDGNNNADTEASTQEDYPSVQQVADACKAANVKPIFLISGTDICKYDEAAKLMDGVVLELKKDSSNIVSAANCALDKLFPTCLCEDTVTDVEFDLVSGCVNVDTNIASTCPSGNGKDCTKATVSHAASPLLGRWYLLPLLVAASAVAFSMSA